MGSKQQERYEKRRLRKERQRNEKTVHRAVKIQCNSQAKEKASKMHISSPIVVQTQPRFGQVEEGIRKASAPQTTATLNSYYYTYFRKSLEETRRDLNVCFGYLAMVKRFFIKRKVLGGALATSDKG